MQIEAMASGAAGAVSHPLTAQVINKGPGIWGNMVAGLMTGVIAFAGMVPAARAARREEVNA
jgi:hypothetical protein